MKESRKAPRTHSEKKAPEKVVAEPVEAPKAIVPAAPRAVGVASAFEEDAGAGFEGADQSSFAMPFLTVLQTGSPQCKRGEGYIEGAKAGDFYNTVTHEVFDGERGVVVVPSAYQQREVVWVPKDEGGGFRGSHPRGTFRLEGPGALERGKSGSFVLPAGAKHGDEKMDLSVVPTAYHTCVLIKPNGAGEPVFLAMKSTQLKHSRTWMTNMNSEKWESGKKPGTYFTPPTYANAWRLTTKPESNKAGDWFGLKIERERVIDLTTEDSPDVAVYAEAKQLRDRIDSGSVLIDESAVAHDVATASEGDDSTPFQRAGIPEVSDLARRFMERFRGLDRAHGSYAIGRKDPVRGKVGGRSRTLREPPTEELWADHLAGRLGLGIVPLRDDATVLFAALDIDSYKDLDHKAFVVRARELSLPLVVCTTKSGGAHLYLFLSEPAPAQLVRDRMLEWAIALGHPKCEVFPKQILLADKEDVGNWINMPYFEAERTNRYALDGEGNRLDAEGFLAYAASRATTAVAVHALTTAEDDLFAGAPPCLQHLYQTGTPEGYRNNAMCGVATYCKKRFGEDWKGPFEERNQSKFLKAPLPADEVIHIQSSYAKKEYSYRCTDEPLVSACNRPVCLRRKYGVGGSAEDSGVMLDSLVKIETDPPTWLVSVNGQRIRLAGTGDLMNQTLFARTCIDRLNIFPKAIKTTAWHREVQRLLEKVDPVEAPEDASNLGQFNLVVERHCASASQHWDQILVGRAVSEGNRTYFRSMDVLNAAERRKIRVTPHEAWEHFRSMAGENEIRKVKGASVRVWSVPTPLSLQTEPFDIPEIPQDGPDISTPRLERDRHRMARVRKLHGAGKTLRQIATKVEASHVTVAGDLDAMGLERKRLPKRGRRRRNLAGRRFGKLRVIRRDGNNLPARWRVRCTCGSVTSKDERDLPRIKSCGCGRRRRRTGGAR